MSLNNRYGAVNLKNLENVRVINRYDVDDIEKNLGETIVSSENALSYEYFDDNASNPNSEDSRANNATNTFNLIIGLSTLIIAILGATFAVHKSYLL